MSISKISFITLMIAIFIVSILNTAKAESVYVISNTVSSELQAYEIEGANLIYQEKYSCKTETSAGTGAVGLAMDSSENGDFLFVTFEGLNLIELVNAKTMEYVDDVEAPQAINLTGIAVNHTGRKCYVLQRFTNHLYVYS